MRSAELIALLLATTAAAGREQDGPSAGPDPKVERPAVRTVRKRFDDPIASWGHVETGRQENDSRPSDKATNARLKAWIGRDVDALVAAWGSPKRKHVDDHGNDVYVFANDGIVPSPTEHRAATTVKAVDAPLSFSLNFYCDVSFRVRPNKRIVGWRYVGNNCNWED